MRERDGSVPKILVFSTGSSMGQLKWVQKCSHCFDISKDWPIENLIEILCYQCFYLEVAMGLTGFLVSDVLLWRILHLIHILCQSKDYCKCRHITVQMTATVHWGNKVVVWFIILILEILGIFSVAHFPVIKSISYLLYCKLLAKTKQNKKTTNTATSWKFLGFGLEENLLLFLQVLIKTRSQLFKRWIVLSTG